MSLFNMLGYASPAVDVTACCRGDHSFAFAARPGILHRATGRSRGRVILLLREPWIDRGRGVLAFDQRGLAGRALSLGSTLTIINLMMAVFEALAAAVTVALLISRRRFFYRLLIDLMLIQLLLAVVMAGLVPVLCAYLETEDVLVTASFRSLLSGDRNQNVVRLHAGSIRITRRRRSLDPFSLPCALNMKRRRRVPSSRRGAFTV